MEIKMPLIDQQRQDYERALASHEQLSIRLDSAMRESADKDRVVAELKGAIQDLNNTRAVLQQEVRRLACGCWASHPVPFTAQPHPCPFLGNA
jgi:predicted methyltransferase MtxX (methanogen marker protein 4)